MGCALGIDAPCVRFWSEETILGDGVIPFVSLGSIQRNEGAGALLAHPLNLSLFLTDRFLTRNTTTAMRTRPTAKTIPTIDPVGIPGDDVALDEALSLSLPLLPWFLVPLLSAEAEGEGI